MTKPDSRKASKSADKNGAKKKQPKAAQQPKPKVVKEAGPRPASYDPNPAKVRARQITEARFRYPEFCQGKPGYYLIGLINGENNPTFKMEVKMFRGKTENFLIIEGEVEYHGKRVYIRFDDIFGKPEHAHYAHGTIGVIQFEMLTFIQKAVSQELLLEKMRRQRTVVEEPAQDPLTNIAEVQQTQVVAEERSSQPSDTNIDYSMAMKFTVPILIGKMKEGDKSRLVYLGENDSRAYFMRERVAGAQKIRLIRADDHPELTAIMEAHPQGVDVDVRSVIDGLRPGTDIGTLGELRNARFHLIQWLHDKLPEIGFRPRKQANTQT